jgi:hypothetical protein
MHRLHRQVAIYNTTILSLFGVVKGGLGGRPEIHGEQHLTSIQQWQMRRYTCRNTDYCADEILLGYITCSRHGRHVAEKLPYWR